MKSLLEIPIGERWSYLDRELPEIIRAQVSAAAGSVSIDPVDEIPIEDLSKRHNLGERAMVNRLKALGGKPYQMGARWFIRRASLVIALQGAEAEKNGGTQ